MKNKLKILELFSGTGSFSKVAEARGHKVFTIDIDSNFNPSLCKDILKLELKDIPFKPNVIWASPPCTEYSHAKRSGIRDIFMKDLPFIDVSYCKYGMPYRKQTRLWNNTDLKLKVCNKDCRFIKDGKHIGSAGNGRKKYTDKNYTRIEKYVIPRKLCLEILNQCQKKTK